MNRSKLKLYVFSTLLSMSMLCAFSFTANAQDEMRESKSVSISTGADGKVTLKVTKRVGNDETNFEKTYDSYEDMQNDPDLEKYGVNPNNFGFGGGASGFGANPKFFFHNGPGQQFWDDDLDLDSLRNRIHSMMRGGFGSSFGFDDDAFMDMDSLMNSFRFSNKNGRFFFNGEEVMDIDSLREAMRDKFGAFKFDFDFGDWQDSFSGNWDYDHDDEDHRVITRAQVFVRSARAEDKAVAGTEAMEALELRDISFYPNPSDGRFDVEMETVSDSQIQVIIVDKNANEVFNKLSSPKSGYFNFSVDLSREGKGIYVMKVLQDGKALTKRIIVE